MFRLLFLSPQSIHLHRRIYMMDLATSQSVLGHISASRSRGETNFTEATLTTEEDNTTKAKVIHQLFSEGYDYAFIEQYMNRHHAPVSSPVRQELWLTFNRGRLSEVLRWHHSQVLDLACSDPATYNCPDLLLTDIHCTKMQNQMRHRLQEVEQSFQSSSNVKWGAKLRNNAKWEYLKDEIVLLYRWLKQQTTHGRGMNTVRGEMSRRYGDLFKFRDTTYFTKLSDWGESSSSHGGSSQHATPWSQPDTPFDNNAAPEDDVWIPGLSEIPENHNWGPEHPDIGKDFHPAPLLVHNKPEIMPPELPLTNRHLFISNSLQLQHSSKLDSAGNIESDRESHGSCCSTTTVSTIVSEIRSAIDDVMDDYEEPGQPYSGLEGQPTFDNLIDWEGHGALQKEDIEMREDEDTGSVRHNTSMQEVQNDAGEPWHHVSTQKAQGLFENNRQVDSGYADDELTTLSDTTQVVQSTEPGPGLTSNRKSRPGIRRPKNVAGGPTALVEVALQTSPRSQKLAKGFGKSAENLKMFSKIQEFQIQNTPSLHTVPELHHLATMIYDHVRDFSAMKALTESLLRQCPNIMSPDKDGNTAGHIALATPLQLYRPEYPTLWWIKSWLNSGNGGITCRNHKGETLLHYAAQNGYISVVTELLLRGADPNSKNNAGLSVIEVCDDALDRANSRVTVAQKMASVDSTLEWEARAGESARIADCAQLLRFHLA